MPQYIFFSWQSDIPNNAGRSLIEGCLNRAIGILRKDAEVDPVDRDLAVDRDTLDVPGSPSIMETIFGKIDRAAVFLSDLTYVAQRRSGGLMPNPNVCIEHGYALKTLGSRKLIAVMNTAMGHPDDHELPFDVRHTRRPFCFNCPENAGADVRRQAQEALTKHLVTALKAIFKDDAAQPSTRNAVQAEPHPHDVELLGRVRQQLPPVLRRFLHHHSFGTSFLRSRLDLLHELDENWTGAAFEFHDPVLQTSFAEVCRLAGEFCSLISTSVFPNSSDPRMGTPKTDYDAAHGVQPRTLQVIRDLNAKAADLCTAMDSFERTARDRIRVASGAHAVAAGPAAADPRRTAADRALTDLASDNVRGRVPVIVAQPRLTLRLAPFAATDSPRLDAGLVKNMQLRFPPSTDVLVEAGLDGQQWWSNGPQRRLRAGMNPEAAWMMRLVRPGNLEWQEQIGERISDDPDIRVDGRELEDRIVRALERMAAIAAGLGLDGPALALVVLDGVEDVMLARARSGGRPMRRPQVVLPVTVLASLKLPLKAALQEQLETIWQTAGWAEG